MISPVLWLEITMNANFLRDHFVDLLLLVEIIVNSLIHISPYFQRNGSLSSSPSVIEIPPLSLRLSWEFGFCLFLFLVLYICWKTVCDSQTRNASPFGDMHGSVLHASDEKHDRMHDLLGSLPSFTLAASMHLLPMPNRRKNPNPKRRSMLCEITTVIRRIWLETWQLCNFCSYFLLGGCSLVTQSFSTSGLRWHSIPPLLFLKMSIVLFINFNKTLPLFRLLLIFKGTIHPLPLVAYCSEHLTPWNLCCCIGHHYFIFKISWSTSWTWTYQTGHEQYVVPFWLWGAFCFLFSLGIPLLLHIHFQSQASWSSSLLQFQFSRF